MTDGIDPDDSLVPPMETPLDLAFERARADPEETAAFYEALFAATLFLPIEGAYDEHGEESDTEASSITPVLYEVEDVPTLVIFDSEERLARWADEPLDYVGLSGQQLFAMFEGEQQVALNLGVAASSVVIPAEVVQWLHERAQDSAEAEEIVGRVEVAPPPELSHEAVARVTARLAGLRREIEEAAFFSLGIDSDQDAATRRVVLGVVLSEVGTEDAEAVAQALAQTARGAFEGERPVEVALLGSESPLMRKAREIGFSLPLVQIGMLH